MQAIPDNLDYSEAEHIYLGDDSDDSPIQATPSSVDYRLTLRRPTHGAEQIISLYDDGKLLIETTNRKTKDRYSLQTRFLDATPTVTRQIARRTFLTAGISALISAGLLALPLSLGFLEPWRLAGGILLATVSLFSVLLAFYRTGDTLRFASLHGRAWVLTIRGGIRCQHRCTELIARLEKITAEARNQAPSSDLLRDEMREHHRLKSDGVIDDADYEAAKLRILSAHD